jgi:hypothetical protein
MLKVTQHTLLQELKKLNLEAQVQEETNQIYLIFKHERREFPLFIRILHEGELLQLLTFIPTNVKPECLNDLGRFLHMVNKELDVPGFCLDEGSGTVFYRLILPSFQKEISPAIFEAFLNTSQVVCKTFSPAIEAIGNGVMTLEEVIKKAQEAGAPKGTES